MTSEPRKHPSGRPIRKPIKGVQSVWHVPLDGPVTPRLQKQEGASAIGFTANLAAERDWDRE
jgi:hypothetical protein